MATSKKSTKIVVWVMVFLMAAFLLSLSPQQCGWGAVKHKLMVNEEPVDPMAWKSFQQRWRLLSRRDVILITRGTQGLIAVPGAKEWVALVPYVLPGSALRMTVDERLLAQQGMEGSYRDRYLKQLSEVAPRLPYELPNTSLYMALLNLGIVEVGIPPAQVEQYSDLVKNMFARYVLAKRYGVLVTPVEVRDFIDNYCLKPIFREAGPIPYDQYLKAMDMGPDDHVGLVEEILTILKLEQMIETSVQPDPVAVADEFIMMNERRKVKYLKLPVGLFEKEIEIDPPTAAELRELYYSTDRGALYNVPEKYRVEYVYVNLDDEKAALPAPTDKELEEHYNNNKGRFRYLAPEKPAETQPAASGAAEPVAKADAERPQEPKAPDYRAWAELNDDEKADVSNNNLKEKALARGRERLEGVLKEAVDGAEADTVRIVSDAIAPMSNLLQVPRQAAAAARSIAGSLDAAEGHREEALAAAAGAAGMETHQTTLLSAREIAAACPEVATLREGTLMGTDPAQFSTVQENGDKYLFFYRLLEKKKGDKPEFDRIDPATRARLERDLREEKRNEGAVLLARHKADLILSEMQSPGHSFEEVALDWLARQADEAQATATGGTARKIPETGYFKRSNWTEPQNGEADPLADIDQDLREAFRMTAFDPDLKGNRCKLAVDPMGEGLTFYIIKLADQDPIRKPTAEQFRAGRAGQEKGLRAYELERFRRERYAAIKPLFKGEQAEPAGQENGGTPAQ